LTVVVFFDTVKDQMEFVVCFITASCFVYFHLASRYSWKKQVQFGSAGIKRCWR